jgi:hypothetical protein
MFISHPDWTKADLTEVRRAAENGNEQAQAELRERIADGVALSTPALPLKQVDLAITPGGRIGDNSGLGKPGYSGPRKTDDYTREVAHALMRKGKSKKKAIQMARGIIANWAQGKGNVSPAVRAAAARSLANQHRLDHNK